MSSGEEELIDSIFHAAGWWVNRHVRQECFPARS